MSVSAIVKSAGDSWIICRSKSYSGRIYYFNTLTGKAVWNLSEPEIEKAKNTTKVLENHPDFKIVNCPEPSESPQDSHPLKQIPVHQLMQPKIYNKQIINNSFSECRDKNHFLPYAKLTPIQLNIPIAPFNPSAWNTIPQSMLVSPSNISQPSFQYKSSLLMNKNNDVPSKTSISLSNRFKTLCDSDDVKLDSSSTIRKNNIDGFSKKQIFINKTQAFYNTDLRTLLTSKRRNFTQVSDVESEKCHFEQFGEHTTRNNSQLLHELNNKTIPYDTDDDYWLEENLTTQAKIPKIDTTAIKNLFQVESTSSWYIVADSNVFLNHVNFINILMKSDCQCRLMIPQQVMNKIKVATNSRLRTQAHRAAYLISEKIDENVAFIDQEDTEENILYKDTIINCCTKLIEEGKSVVLLSDDTELHGTECSIPIYTVMEIKKLLNNPGLHAFVPRNFESLKHNRNIKITIENDANMDVVDQQSNTDNSDEQTIVYEYERHEGGYSKSQSNDQNKCLSPNAEVIFEPVLNDMKWSEKKTDDIGVQADPTDLIVEKGNLHTNYATNKIQSDTEFAQTRPIKLKRQSTFDIAKSRKQLKQNKRKALSSLSLISENSIIEKPEDIAPFKLYPTQSMESIINNENMTDTRLSSKNKCDGLIIETPNIENSKSAKTFKYINQDIRQSGERNLSQRNENVMFEVTNQVMEDYLKMKCDEWTSRFVQIMEEVLTQVLQIDPPYVLDTMPPPWNIYEATECVKRRFHNVDDIYDAATKLSSILFEFGASRGKIKTDISPQKYMEMYSYGVYLIDTLQGHLNNVEDLHTAEQSLAKLLRDIQDPHLDPCNHDLFTDSNAENQTICNEQDALNDTVESNENDSNNKNLNEIADNSTPITKSSNISFVSSKYRLRSHRKRLLQENENPPPEIIFIRNIDLKSSFFTSLNLKKNCEVDNNNDVQDTIMNDVENNNEMVDDSEVVNDSEVVKDSEVVNYSEMVNDSEVVNDSEAVNDSEVVNDSEAVNDNEVVKDNVMANDYEIENNSPTDNIVREIKFEKNKAHTEPKIIRNFTKCIEFEEKLKNKDLETDSVQDNWYIQSDSDYTGNEELDYENNEYFYDNDYDDYVYNNKQSGTQLHNIENKNDTLKLFMEKIKDEIKTTFLVIHSFCSKSYETLSSSENKVSKTNIQILGKQTLTHVNNLCDALSSILSRDAGDCVFRLKALLDINNLDENVIDDGDFEEYTAFIKKCVEQGSLLRDSIKLVIDASEE